MVIAIDYVTQGINLEPTDRANAVSSSQTSKSEDVPVKPVAHSVPPVPKTQKAIEFSTETFEPKIANPSKSKNIPRESSRSPEPQKPNSNAGVPKTKETTSSEEIPKPLKLPKSAEPIPHIKAPNKPKKRF